MESERRKSADQEKNEAATRLLEKLRAQLSSSNASHRRRAAFNLSWMQEDGLEILENALFSNLSVTAKNAAAYGLRNMRGRMKKMALEVLKRGLKHRDRSTRDTCKNALQLLVQKVPEKPASQQHSAMDSRIREISRGSRPRVRVGARRTRQ